MPWGAAIAAGGAILGGVISSDASKSASNQAANSAQASLNNTEAIQHQVTSEAQPYMGAGDAALQQQERMTGLIGTNANGSKYTYAPTDPAYQFNLSQGQAAIDKAAPGSGYSSGTLKNALTYAQGLASNEFNNTFNRLGSLSSLGANEVNATGGIATDLNGQAASALGGIGAANAAGSIAQGNIWSNVANNQGVQSAIGQARNSYFGSTSDPTGVFNVSSSGGYTYQNPSTVGPQYMPDPS